jgi:NTP pyrophosphatase (non-canonical NTP hydrolase)
VVELIEYQRFVEYTTSRESKGISEFIDRIVTIDANVPLLLTASVGLASESGEFSEIVKKVIFQGKELNVDVRYHMLRELGDICWYLANAANALGADLEEIVKMNVAKLESRYPNGFEVSRSENRAKGDI